MEEWIVQAGFIAIIAMVGLAIFVAYYMRDDK
jgi:hypothetical protein